MPFTSPWAISLNFVTSAKWRGVSRIPPIVPYWSIPCFAYTLANGVFAHCQACAFDKCTSFLCSRMCPGCATHEPWGVDSQEPFNTSKEAEYLPGMCQALCDVKRGPSPGRSQYGAVGTTGMRGAVSVATPGRRAVHRHGKKVGPRCMSHPHAGR